MPFVKKQTYHLMKQRYQDEQNRCHQLLIEKEQLQHIRKEDDLRKAELRNENDRLASENSELHDQYMQAVMEKNNAIEKLKNLQIRLEERYHDMLVEEKKKWEAKQIALDSSFTHGSRNNSSGREKKNKRSNSRHARQYSACSGEPVMDVRLKEGKKLTVTRYVERPNINEDQPTKQPELTSGVEKSDAGATECQTDLTTIQETSDSVAL